MTHERTLYSFTRSKGPGQHDRRSVAALLGDAWPSVPAMAISTSTSR